MFTVFIDRSAGSIKADYDASDDRTFKIKYAQYIHAGIAQLASEGLTSTRFSGRNNVSDKQPFIQPTFSPASNGTKLGKN